MSKKEKGERDWNSERILFSDMRASSLRTGTRRKLQEVLRDLAPLEKQGKIEGFFSNTENATLLGGLVEGIRDAMMEYQVCALNPSYLPYLILPPDFVATRHERSAARHPH